MRVLDEKEVKQVSGGMYVRTDKGAVGLPFLVNMQTDLYRVLKKWNWP